MKRIFFVFLFLPLWLHAHWDHLFSDEEDLTLFHHVNVISGHLNLCFQDALVHCAKPFALMRTYTSAGALERAIYDPDLHLKKVRGGWLIQGGWNLLPHANLFVEPGPSGEDYRVYLPEKNGNFLSYHFSHWEKNRILCLKPDLKVGQCSGSLSGRTNPRNNLLKLDLDQERATLYLPDGSVFAYGSPDFARNSHSSHYLKLVKETSPSKQVTQYIYDKKERLARICLQNPSGSKTWGSIDFTLLQKFRSHKPKDTYHFRAVTSNQQTIDYHSLNFKYRNYLNGVQSNARPHESLDYHPGREGIGARVESLILGGKIQLFVDYFTPADKKKDRKWAEEPDEKPLYADRVHVLKAPLGPQGQLIPISTFSYDRQSTDVRDIDHLLTRYHHDGDRLLLIEYFNEKDQLASCLKFEWEGPFLKSKIFLNAHREPLFSRAFEYDPLGNVIRETLFGNITGETVGSYSKNYTYLPDFNVPLTEQEEGGLTYRYGYQEGTNLLVSKLTTDGDTVLLREFFVYDEDHMLIAEIADDGQTADFRDLAGMSSRQIKRYTLDPHTGLCLSCKECYWDLNENREVLLKTRVFAYSPQNRVIAEELYDALGVHRYTIHTEYDAAGHVTSQTTPLGQKNTYLYDVQGNLLESHEIGSPKKMYTYNASGCPISCQEGDLVTLSDYDSKGRLLSQTDQRERRTVQTYDAFGRCIQTEFPEIQDAEGVAYRPTIHFSYDVCGNLSTTTTPSGATTHTTYNVFKKPIHMIQPDGSEVTHLYDKKGLLIKTVNADCTEVHYTHDLFQRVTSKTIVSQEGDCLSAEIWEYSAFHLLAYTDPRGLRTQYIYDGAGRKIEEIAEGRKTVYQYDSLGFLERTGDGDLTHIKIHDVQGRVIEEWTEDLFGHVENHMYFSYNEQNQKDQALRMTSQGAATDLFSYNDRGQLIAHTDPLGHLTQWVDEYIKNSLNQWILQKSVIDPVGNSSVETYDALNHLISCEKKDPEGNTVSREHFFYDRAGNRVKRCSLVYLADLLIKEICTQWKYDAMGHLIEQVEAGEKTTLYERDCKGRMTRKVLPSGISIFYVYDGIDRLLELYSSDQSVHYTYCYEKGSDPVVIWDQINHTTLQRRYNRFGELIDEINPRGLIYRWERDHHGRVQQFCLPDQSSIVYAYQGGHLISVEKRDVQNHSLYTHTYHAFDSNGHITQEALIGRLGSLWTTRDLLERVSIQSSFWLKQKVSYGPSGLIAKITHSLFGNTDYAYDPLNQVVQEGERAYCFDSCGNPAGCQVNACNQILSNDSCRLYYDADGNPIQKETAEETTCYTYDALGRLVTCQTLSHRIDYVYDPLSRLLSKTVTRYFFWGDETTTSLYVYDQDKEIGILSEERQFLELKVLGVGVAGDIGAAVAIELQNQVFAPLHDLSGNIIGLINAQGELEETYQIDLFGKEKTTADPINPWRFCSKRSEQGLVFFGKRFYDPSLGRWLTPDPAGFIDSPNLYVYVLNSPLNRLDLFGFHSFPWSNRPDDPVNIDVPIEKIYSAADASDLIFCKGFIGDTQVDWVVSCGHWHKLQFSAEEIHKGVINIVDHFSEVIPKEGIIVGLITWQNGINTSFKEFAQMSQTIADKIPEGPLFVGLHNPTEGTIKDVVRVWREKQGVETPTVQRTRQMFTTLVDLIPHLNPDLVWLHIEHSEAGLIGKLGIEGMTDDRREQLARQLCVIGLGSAAPIPSGYAMRAMNIYSEKDGVTKRFAEPFLNDPNYDIRIVPCMSPSSQRGFLTGDHSFKGNTYQYALTNSLDDLRLKYGIYDAKSR